MRLCVCLVLAAVGPSQRVEERPQIWSFDADAAGNPARGFETPTGAWEVVEGRYGEEKYKALAQTAKSEKPVFNIAICDAKPVADLDLAVRLLAIAGEIDQGGGVIWRAKDAKNYYIARYNPIEDNLRLYYVIDGKRTQLANADIERRDGWYALRVTMTGDHIEVFLDSKKYLDVHDSAIKDAGKIGLWSKADAQTHFDDLTLKTSGAAN